MDTAFEKKRKEIVRRKQEWKEASLKAFIERHGHADGFDQVDDKIYNPSEEDDIKERINSSEYSKDLKQNPNTNSTPAMKNSKMPPLSLDILDDDQALEDEVLREGEQQKDSEASLS